VQSRAWTELSEQRRIGDDPAALRDAAQSLLRGADALLLTGGVSMGPRDFIPAVLAELGARVVFHRLPQRPGKPILGAVLPDGRPILGLPGNPQSVMVTARRFGLPVLARLAGLREPGFPWPARLEGAGETRIDLWWHRLARVVGPGVVEAVDGRGSGDVSAAARSDGFCEVPPGQSGPGPWPFYPWS
jgi:molybdenum cofactor synthesis domain-containing protein